MEHHREGGEPGIVVLEYEVVEPVGSQEGSLPAELSVFLVGAIVGTVSLLTSVPIALANQVPASSVAAPAGACPCVHASLQDLILGEFVEMWNLLLALVVTRVR